MPGGEGLAQTEFAPDAASAPVWAFELSVA